MIALGRESLADPEWPNKVAANARGNISPYCLPAGVCRLFIRPGALKNQLFGQSLTGRKGLKTKTETQKVMVVEVAGWFEAA